MRKDEFNNWIENLPELTSTEENAFFDEMQEELKNKNSWKL